MIKINTIPAWQQHDGETAKIGQEPVRWSGKLPPPAIGATVDVNMNGFGVSTVEGYFIDNGFLGLMVRPKVRPKWHQKQHPEAAVIGVFGAEIAWGDACSA